MTRVLRLCQALLRQRVGLQIGIDALHADQLAGHELEGFEHAPPRLLGGIEERDAGLIGGRFFVLTVGKQGAERGVLTAIGDPHPGLSRVSGAGKRAADHGGETNQLQHQRRRFRPRHLRP